MRIPTNLAGALAFAVAVHVARFLLILAAIGIAPLIGVTGWYIGLFANVVCAVFAAILVSVLGLWRRSGMFRLWRSWTALLFLLPFVAEALVWALVPDGLVFAEPGFGLWALTLLLVGVNEELTSRVVVLETLRESFSLTPAVVMTAILFGLQHLSILATTPSRIDVVLVTVLLSTIAGFAMAAFQARFAWIWPLVLTHATSDLTILMGAEAPLWLEAAAHVMFVAVGILLLRNTRARLRAAGGDQATAGRDAD
ncbi:CPBP family intramembrane glutamic endopeptidase [Microbacterium karelineae]|uniref:CPBP family intramembrane glutamic endopeptidase n=1 Tax=Microbacterium karelineae TaxID=2654283 RepID=UPI0018D296C5|nr:CPBP family intramembrane glutamic endopeptidase [Microbacterium karelineae]